MKMQRRLQGGFTLVELMVVIAIISVLAVLAIVNLKGRPGIGDTAAILSNQMREASRKAITGGVVDQTQVNTIAGIPRRARSRLRVRYDSTPQRQIITVEIRDEAQADADEWLEVSRQIVHSDISVFAFDNSLALTPGTTPAVGNQIQSSDNTGAANSEVSIYFAPDGTSIDDNGNALPFSLFLQTINTSQVKQLRVVLLPLQASALVLQEW